VLQDDRDMRQRHVESLSTTSDKDGAVLETT